MPEPPPDPASAIQRVALLGFHFETREPYLFCVYHDDHDPAGNRALGLRALLAGRDIGQDFVIVDGFRMFYGATVPGVL